MKWETLAIAAIVDLAAIIIPNGCPKVPLMGMIVAKLMMKSDRK